MEMRFCEHCGGAIYPDDVAPIKLQIKGKTIQVYFHNRHNRDCLAQKIEQLRQQFNQAAPK